MARRIYYMQGMDGFGAVDCPVPGGFWPSAAEVNKWCDCKFASDPNENAKCKSSQVGWPWTVAGKIARGMNLDESAIASIGPAVGPLIPGARPPVTNVVPVSPGTGGSPLIVGGSSGFSMPGMAGGMGVGLVALLAIGGLAAWKFGVFGKKAGAMSGYSRHNRRSRRVRRASRRRY